MVGSFALGFLKAVVAVVFLIILALFASGSASASGSWKRITVDRQKGRIDATLSYETRAVENHPGYEPMGLLAPWCGDQYLLGRKDRCNRVLTQALARGYLNDPHGGRAAMNLLHKTLAAWGYDRG